MKVTSNKAKAIPIRRFNRSPIEKAVDAINEQIRSRNMGTIDLARLEENVRDNPVQTLLIAAGAGLLLGLIIRRRL